MVLLATFRWYSRSWNHSRLVMTPPLLTLLPLILNVLATPEARHMVEINWRAISKLTYSLAAAIIFGSSETPHSAITSCIDSTE